MFFVNLTSALSLIFMILKITESFIETILQLQQVLDHITSSSCCNKQSHQSTNFNIHFRFWKYFTNCANKEWCTFFTTPHIYHCEIKQKLPQIYFYWCFWVCFRDVVAVSGPGCGQFIKRLSQFVHRTFLLSFQPFHNLHKHMATLLVVSSSAPLYQAHMREVDKKNPVELLTKCCCTHPMLGWAG